MQYLNSFVSFVFSRATLTFIGLVVLALVIWFVGPLIAVDGLRPLATVGVRVSLLVVLLALAIRRRPRPARLHRTSVAFWNSRLRTMSASPGVGDD
ncbi:hypothetical protein WKW80_36735 [Variovorax humicola]|uniref:Uncharacterized protein n=1 Tax=Variovorax humicola TaxID=1769758 RepID=A0ABU8WBM5_9BURK